MGIFRRGTKEPAAVTDETSDAQDSSTLDDLDPDSTAQVGRSGDHEDRPGGPAGVDELEGAGGADPAPPAPAYRRSEGPFDVSEVPDPQGRLDLGALWVQGLPGMELRLEVEQETQSLVGVTAVLGESAVQLQAFAAPRTAGIWDDIRSEIAASIVGQGGTADDVAGPLGPELMTRMPGQGPDGRTVFSPARFVGVDGPRWFLRAVLSGRAAVDEESAAPLLDVVKATVVVRGDEAMAPRDLLPLRLPETEQPEQPEQEAAEEPAEGAAPRSADDLHPFDRGPEITEIR